MHRRNKKRPFSLSILLILSLAFTQTAFASEPNQCITDDSDASYYETDIYETTEENDILSNALANDPYLTDSTINTTTYMSKYTDDLPKVVLVQPANPTGEEIFSIEILKKFISELDGYTPAVISDSIAQGSKGFEISVGNTNRPHGTPKYTSNDSYSIKSYNNGISLTGVGKLGLMHSAMRFVQDFGGYYFVSWEELATTNQTHFKYNKNGVSIDYERPFVFTDIDTNFTYLDPRYDMTDPYHDRANSTSYQPPYTGRLYSLMMGLNGYFANTHMLPNGMPGKETWYLSTVRGSYTEPSTVSGLAAGHAHTLLAEFLPASKYYAEHPDWYCASNSYQALNHGGYVADSKKTRNSSQLCLYTALHDQEAYNLILQHCYDILSPANGKYDKDAPIQIISVSINDGPNMCHCDKCVKHRASYGAPYNVESYEILDLVNHLSQDIHKNGAYPNVYIDTLSYTWTLYAPQGMTADDHVIIRWAPINRCYGHYLNCSKDEDERNYEYYKELQKWLKIAKHVWIWDYNINFMSTFSPYPNVDVMQHDIKLYKEIGIEGVYLQSNFQHYKTNMEFSAIRNYILARMLQDPTRDYESELAFYTDNYYGEAGKYIRAYQKHMEKQWGSHHMISANRDHQANYDVFMFDSFADEQDFSDHAHRMPDSEIDACEVLWQKINEIAEHETPERKDHINRMELSWRLVKSTLRVYEFENPDTYKTENEKLLNDLKAADITQFSLIHGTTPSQCKYLDRCPELWSTSQSATPSEVRSVTVTATDSVITAGKTSKFKVRVLGLDASQAVTWTIQGAQSPDTSISSDGLLSVGKDETATTLTVRATSKQKANKYGEATIQVTPPLNGWTELDGFKYYYADGIAKTGWLSLNNEWYYMDEQGRMTTDWIKYNQKWYFMNQDGTMATGWVKYNNKWYYLNTNGTMATGWVKYSDKWYYFNSSGTMATGWLKYNNKWYYLNPNGTMATGWLKYKNDWYYLGTDGIMITGWLKYKNDWYYFNSDGIMVTGTVTINGKSYKFNSNGVWIN